MAEELEHIKKLNFPFCFEMPKFVEHYLKAYGIELLAKTKEPGNSYKTYKDGKEVIVDIYAGGLFLNGEELTVNNLAVENRNVRFTKDSRDYELRLSYYPGESRTVDVACGTKYLDKIDWVVRTFIREDETVFQASTDYLTTTYEVTLYTDNFSNIGICIGDKGYEPKKHGFFKIVPGQKHGTAKEIVEEIAKKFRKPKDPLDIQVLDLMLHDPRLEEKIDELLKELPKEINTTYEAVQRKKLLEEYQSKLAELDKKVNAQNKRIEASVNSEYGLVDDNDEEESELSL